MNEMYFSVPYGMHEMSFGIPDEEGEEVFNFYLIFVESAMMNLRLVTVYGDYEEDGALKEMQTLSSGRREGANNEFEFEFDVSETKKVKIYLCMGDCQYTVYVKH